MADGAIEQSSVCMKRCKVHFDTPTIAPLFSPPPPPPPSPSEEGEEFRARG